MLLHLRVTRDADNVGQNQYSEFPMPATILDLNFNVSFEFLKLVLIRPYFKGFTFIVKIGKYLQAYEHKLDFSVMFHLTSPSTISNFYLL